MIEIIPKPAQKLPLWQNILFYFSIAILISFFLSYFILGHFLKTSSKTLQDLEATLSREKTAPETALEQEIFGYQKKINAFIILFGKHLFASNFFTLLEQTSHPKVWFFQISLEPQKGLASLSGEAEDFQALGQQLSILKEEVRVKNLNLASISVGRKGRIDFTLNLSLNPALFK